MRWKTLVSLLASFGAASLAGCAAPKPPPPPASATLSIDGTYKGSARGSCGATEATMEVRDGHFVLSMFDARTVLDGDAEPNGTLHGERFVGSRELNFAGRVDGPDLRGGSYDGRCALAFTLARVDAAPSVTSP